MVEGRLKATKEKLANAKLKKKGECYGYNENM
jgi:hypothetical protein